jgi:hypothetical protein
LKVADATPARKFRTAISVTNREEHRPRNHPAITSPKSPVAINIIGLLPVESTTPQNGSTTRAPTNEKAERLSTVRCQMQYSQNSTANTPGSRHRRVNNIKDEELAKRSIREHCLPGTVVNSDASFARPTSDFTNEGQAD